MSRVLRAVSIATLILTLSTGALAQSKEAKDKYYKAMQLLDWHVATSGVGTWQNARRNPLPPNPTKAEKLFNEASALAPEWILPVYGLADMNFMLRKYSVSAKYYTKARELDDKKHELDKAGRHDMLDQLGLSYALDADYKTAEAVYQDALKEDPEFPMFHYNLACVYAESHKLGDALEELRKAWEFKDNMPKGQPFPDPRKDDSWREYLDNPKFQDVVREMVV
jgi:tetratricopeptide (TPR) repeat protein